MLEQFLLECQKVIGFALLRFTIGLKNPHHSFILSEVKPIVIGSHTFSRASRQLHVFTLSFDWFIGLSACIVIGQGDYCGFLLRHSIENRCNCMGSLYLAARETHRKELLPS